MRSNSDQPKRTDIRGITLIELLVSMTVLSVLMLGISLIYFSCIKVYINSAWKLPPYDEATMAVNEMSHRLRDAMLIDSFGDNYVVAVLPAKDANRDNVIQIAADDTLSLVAGEKIRLYMSNDSGSLEATGNTLWLATAAAGTYDFVPRKKIAENIHPELNPTDPATGLPRPMFRYYPDETRLWGVEMNVTSTAQVYQETRVQSASAEIYLRNL